MAMGQRTWFARLVIIALLVSFIAAYIWRPGGTRALEFVSDGLYLGAAIVASVLALIASSRFDHGLPQRRVWVLLAAGLGLWAVAEGIWMYFQIGAGRDVPYPSLADIIWGIGYVPLILGMFLGHRGLGVRLPTRQRIVAVIVYAVLLAALAAWLVAPMCGDLPAGSWDEALVGSYYLIGNLTLAFIATLSLIVVWDGLIGRPWLSITIGMLLFALSDTAFAYAAWVGTYAVGRNAISGVIDVVYLAAYLSIALGAYRQATLSLADVTHAPGSA
jgi:hypothetical protein